MFIRFPAFFLIALFCLPGVFTALPLTHAESENSRKNDFAFMARIKGGAFQRGSTFNETKEYLKLCRETDRKCQLWWFEDELPQKRIELDSFWIDIFEVTNARYLEFVQATGHRPALDDSCQTAKCREGNLWDGTSFPPMIRNQPVTQVNWYDANAYCAWMGKRLPSEAEWEKAARGKKANVYPWGGGSPKGKATYQRKWQGALTMTDVGSHPKGESIYGVFDMAGNVWEWVDDWYHFKYYSLGRKKNPRGPANGDFKVVRGGSWVNYENSLRSAFRRWSRPEVRFNDTGFRCAKDDID
jgi:sulfatase modifying factor 1